MLTTPIYTRIMTETEFGRNSLYTSWYNIVFIIVTLELASGVYTRGLIDNEEDADAFSSSLLSLSTFSILIFTAFYFLFHGIINGFTGLSTYLMVLMLVEALLSIAYQFWSNRERVEYRYKKLVALMMTFTVLRPIAGVVAVLIADEGHQVEARVTAVVFVNLLLFGGLYISVLKKGKCLFNKKYWKYALAFNIPLIPHYLSQTLLEQTSRIMIDKYCGSAEVAYYSVASSLATVMIVFNSAISSTMNPWIYRSIKNKEYRKIGNVSYIILFMIASLNLMMVAMGPELLKILAPGSYGAAVWVIPPIAVRVYFMFLYNLFATFEYYFGKTKFVSIATVFSALANIGLNAIFVPMFGFVAAGYVTLVCYILYAMAHYIFMRRVCSQHLDGCKIYNFKIILLIALALAGACAVMVILYDYIIIRYAVLLAVVALIAAFHKKMLAVFHEMKASK